MIQVNITDNGKRPFIGAEESAGLLEFCLAESSRVSLMREHTEEIDTEVLGALIAEAMGTIIGQRDECLAYIDTLTEKELRKDGFANRETAADIIRQQAEDRLRALDEACIKELSGKDTLQEDLAPYGLIRREITAREFADEGPWFDCCWFPADLSVLRAALEEDIFAAPVEMGGYSLKDPSFADEDGTVWAEINSGARTVSMKLTEDQYEEFETLGISHTCYPPKRQKRAVKKALIVGAISAASIVGAALGVTVTVKKHQKQKRENSK